MASSGSSSPIRGCNQFGSPEPTPVGQFSPNAFGLFDMHGNVAQWVEDCYSESFAGIPLNGKAWTSNDCERHVVRGGGWDSGPAGIRSAARSYGTLPRRDFNIGFRVARALDALAPQSMIPKSGNRFSEKIMLKQKI